MPAKYLYVFLVLLACAVPCAVPCARALTPPTQQGHATTAHAQIPHTHTHTHILILPTGAPANRFQRYSPRPALRQPLPVQENTSNFALSTGAPVDCFRGYSSHPALRKSLFPPHPKCGVLVVLAHRPHLASSFLPPSRPSHTAHDTQHTQAHIHTHTHFIRN